MRTSGYIKIPRSINTLPLTARTLLYYLCTEAEYSLTTHPDVGELLPGQLVVSRSKMVKEVGLSAQQIRTALITLQRGGYIVVDSCETCTRISVVWREFAQLNGYELGVEDIVYIMSNNQASNQASNQADTSVNSDNTIGCEDKKNRLTKLSTKLSTKHLTNNSIKYKENNNIHTHSSINLVETKSAPARDTRTHTSVCASPAAVELLEWMAHYTPDLMAMQNPITLAETDELLRMHSVEDIRRILTTAWSKQAYAAHRSTKALCDLFIANDRLLQQKRSAPSEAPSLMTYTEMLDAFAKIGGNMSEHFEAVPQPNGKKPLWRRIS